MTTKRKDSYLGGNLGRKGIALILKSCLCSTTEFMFLIIIPQIPRIFTLYSQCFHFFKKKKGRLMWKKYTNRGKDIPPNKLLNKKIRNTIQYFQ